MPVESWLAQAARVLARHPELVRSADSVRGFTAGGQWMAEALSALRGRRVAQPERRFVALGLKKYGLCVTAGVGAAALAAAATTGPSCAIVFGLLAFYAVEARHVFDFPAAIDYGHRAPTAARVLRHRAGGTISVMAHVVTIAAFMLFGWLANGRLRWNLVVGCLAVIVGYESLRRRAEPTACLFEIGSFAPLTIRRVGDADPGLHPIKLLYASDLHLGAWGASRAMRELQRITVREQPDVVLLGGDLVNTPRALPELRERTRRLGNWAAVAAIPGNHDMRWLARIASAVTEAGGHWLPDGPLRLDGIRIDGVPVRAAGGEGRRLLCAHHPRLFEAALDLGYDSVLAGHLHGGQVILCDVRGRHFPGLLDSRWNGLEFAAGQATLWVSRGLSDTWPMRFRCSREVIVASLRRGGSSALARESASVGVDRAGALTPEPAEASLATPILGDC